MKKTFAAITVTAVSLFGLGGYADHQRAECLEEWEKTSGEQATRMDEGQTEPDPGVCVDVSGYLRLSGIVLEMAGVAFVVGGNIINLRRDQKSDEAINKFFEMPELDHN